jgi:hypothetical protein
MQLVFSGTAWPAARLSDRRNQFDFEEDSATWTDQTFTYGILSTTGKGRKWETTTALGWWRTFAEMDLEDDEAVAGFARRYGDPASELSPERPVHTRHWLTLQTMLRPLAEAWTLRPDNSELMPEGDSEEYADRYESALVSLEIRGPLFMQQKNISKILDRNGFGYGFKLLGDFMFMSAAEMFFRRARMRKCVVCGHWFEQKRSTAMICSAACHVRKAKEQDEGKRNGARQQA